MTNRPGLLSTRGLRPEPARPEPEYLWRYRFVDPAVALFFRGETQDDAERERLMRSLFTNLVDVRLSGGIFDITIGRLARELGEREAATMVEDRFATRQELLQLETDATVLLAVAADLGSRRPLPWPKSSARCP